MSLSTRMETHLTSCWERDDMNTLKTTESAAQSILAFYEANFLHDIQITFVDTVSQTDKTIEKVYTLSDFLTYQKIYDELIERKPREHFGVVCSATFDLTDQCRAMLIISHANEQDEEYGIHLSATEVNNTDDIYESHLPIAKHEYCEELLQQKIRSAITKCHDV